MKIVFLSDLHLSNVLYCDRFRIQSLFKNIQKQKADYVVLGGDICDYYGIWSEFFSIITKEIDSKILILLGNHDTWCINKSLGTTREEIYALVKKTCDEFDIVFLEEQPIIDGNVLLCGTIAWYDYGIKPIDLNDEYLWLNKRIVNNDGNYTISTINDIDYANICKERLTKNIKLNQKKVDHIYAFTHVPVLKECLTSPLPGYSQRQWDISNPYFYNISLGKELLKNPKLRLIVSGHIHRYMTGTVQNQVSYVTSGSDYGKPEILVIEMEEGEVKKIERLS